jgi:Kef-type K+ transport system membrane component KefB
MGFLLSALCAWDIITGEAPMMMFKEGWTILICGLCPGICFGRYIKRLPVFTAKDDNPKSKAKKELSFFLKTFILSALTYFLLYRLLWYVIVDSPDANPYKQIFVALCFGIFFGIYLMGYYSKWAGKNLFSRENIAKIIWS